MDPVGVNVIETAALGRPFQLGMLYDCRKDALIPGITLWDPEKLQQSLRVRPQINTYFKVTASDSIQDKSNLMNIDGSLKLSVLGGLVSVSGTAKYLNDTKKSFRQQRLTLHYHSTCRYEELTMNRVVPENIVHREVLDNDTATHVVTAVLYGADACFVFDREVSSDEKLNTVEGEAKVALEKLKFISVDANINLKMNDTQKNAVQKFTCTFYGDFQLPSNPTSFEDALKVFSDLPKLLGEKKELAVPLRVWLYPLDKLLSRASKLQKDISMDLILDTESVIESLNTTEMKCSDLACLPASTFAEFQDKILQMKQNCYRYKLRLMKKLGSLLPNIRGDVMKETDLNDLLQDHNESPFSEGDLAEWLKERERESDVIKSVLRQLKDAGAQVEDNIDLLLMELELGNLVSYTFTSLNWSDVLLLQQTTYLSNSTKGETDENGPDSEQKSWLTPEMQKTLRSNLKIFKNLIDSKDREPAKFIVSSKEMKNNPGCCILLYESECDEAVCFIPPSKPACPITEEVKDNSVVLKVPPSCSSTVELRLLYKLKQDRVWRSKPVMKDENTVTLTDLRAGTEYEIKCAALGKLNYTVYSDVISVTTERRNRSVMEYCGLINQGSTSYLNAVLQTLYMTQEYREGVMRLERREDSSDGDLKESESESDSDDDSDGESENQSDFIEELKSLFNKLDKESHRVSTAGISKSLGITDVYKHKDAKKYLDLILSKTPEASEIFKVKVKKTGRCSSCKKMTSEQSDIFTLMIYRTQSDHMGSAVNERIDEMRKDLHCSHCSNRPMLENINSHFEFPQRLILGLNNFRNEAMIAPCIEVSTHKYELYAIINLYGTVKDGHYNTNIKSDNGNWYRCNDSHVFQVPAEMFSEKSFFAKFKLFFHPESRNSLRCPPAYLVFYKRSLSA
ncbi:verrucotoxin subunit beta-like isoform X2 [Ctenopharyngodon idella]|uniref:verrucotoxin subunit beta-like isoform X2 n=1 Tax=Ctenopharyngodon idella TaxID=7959 RepID=UPI00222E5B11|nr:verrucotoxin subunit beta-like isoform X2 [Ctenopharyngodon idella]